MDDEMDQSSAFRRNGPNHVSQADFKRKVLWDRALEVSPVPGMKLYCDH